MKLPLSWHEEVRPTHHDRLNQVVRVYYKLTRIPVFGSLEVDVHRDVGDKIVVRLWQFKESKKGVVSGPVGKRILFVHQANNFDLVGGYLDEVTNEFVLELGAKQPGIGVESFINARYQFEWHEYRRSIDDPWMLEE